MKRLVFTLPMTRALRAGLKTETRRTSPPAFSVGDIVAVAEPCTIKPYDEPYLREGVTCVYAASEDADDPDVCHNFDPDELERCAEMPTVINHTPRSGRFMPGWAERTHLRILAIEQQALGDITEANAVAEGFTDREAFLSYFATLHKGPIDLTLRVWVVRFEVVT